MCKSIKRIVLVLLTSLMVLAPINNWGVSFNQTIIAYAAKSTNKENEIKVWISNTGAKYHSKESCSNMKKPRQVTIAEAELKGYKPCQKCYKGNAKTINTNKESERKVWIQSTGSKYHSNSSCSGMKNLINVSLEEAKRLGYKPCSKCMH